MKMPDEKSMKSPEEQISELENCFDRMKRNFHEQGGHTGVVGEYVLLHNEGRGVSVEYRKGRHIDVHEFDRVEVGATATGDLKGTPFAIHFVAGDNHYMEFPVDSYEKWRREEEPANQLVSCWREGKDVVCWIRYRLD